MPKTFRPWNVDQPLELPRSILEFVPLGHVAHFIRNLVREPLDLSKRAAPTLDLSSDAPFAPLQSHAARRRG